MTSRRSVDQFQDSLILGALATTDGTSRVLVARHWHSQRVRGGAVRTRVVQRTTGVNGHRGGTVRRQEWVRCVGRLRRTAAGKSARHRRAV